MALQLQAVVALNTAAFTSGLAGMTATVNKFAGMSMTMFGGVAGQVAAMWAAFGPMGAVAAGMQAVIKTGSSLEHSMRAVASVTGLAGAEMDRVARATREAAAQTSWSAKQAGEAMYALGSAGMSSADVLEASLLPALKLAAATQSETSLATETMTAAMAIWQLQASEAAGVADMFAGAIASSPATMERLADAMKYAGPAGASFNMSLKQVIDNVAAFHVVGLRGQQAGTAFSMALINLTKAASSGAGEVGKALQGWEAGTDDLVGAVRRLKEAGVSTATVIQEMGARAGPGMAALMKLGEEAIRKLSDRVTENSDLQKMYSTQMSSLAGQFMLFKAQVEEVAQKIFVSLGPAFDSIVKGAGNALKSISDLGSKMSWLAGPIRNLLPILIGSAGLYWAFGKLIAIIPGLGGSMTAMWAESTAAWSRGSAAIAASSGRLTGIFAALKTSMIPVSTTLGGLGAMAPKVAIANTGLATATKAAKDGFVAITPAMYKATYGYDLMHNGVTSVTAAQARAIASTKTMTGAVGGLGIAVSVAAAAFIGWKLGSWIREIKFANTTIGGFVDNLALIISGQGGVNAANQAVIDSTQEMVRRQREADAAQAKMAKDAEERSKAAREKMFAEARAADVVREAHMEKLRAEKSAMDNLVLLAKAHEDVAWAQGTMAAATPASEEATDRLSEASAALLESETALLDAVNQKQDAFNNVQNAERELAAAERESAIATYALQTAQSEHAEVLEMLGDNTDAAIDAEKGLAEAESAVTMASSKLKEKQDNLAAAQQGLKDKTDGVADALQGLNDATDEAAAATDAAITEYNTLRHLVGDVGITFDEARKLFKQFGDQAPEVTTRMNRFGESIEDAADNVRWLNENHGIAADILRNEFSREVKDADGFLLRFGRDALAVARYMREHNVSIEDAAKAIAELNAKGKNLDLKPAIEDMTKFGDATIRLGRALARMNKDELEEIYEALKAFAEKLDTLPKDINLAWVEDLAKLRIPSINNIGLFEVDFKRLVTAIANAGGMDVDLKWLEQLKDLKIPSIGGITFFEVDFKRLVMAISNAGGMNVDLKWLEQLKDLKVPYIGSSAVTRFEAGFTRLVTAVNGGAGIDLTWLDSLTAFSLPDTTGWDAFSTTFSGFATAINNAVKPDLTWISDLVSINTVDMDKLKQVAEVLADLPTGTYNASVLIGWEDNETLASIDGHLATICAAKGIIWG